MHFLQILQRPVYPKWMGKWCGIVLKCMTVNGTTLLNKFNYAIMQKCELWIFCRKINGILWARFPSLAPEHCLIEFKCHNNSHGNDLKCQLIAKLKPTEANKHLPNSIISQANQFETLTMNMLLQIFNLKATQLVSTIFPLAYIRVMNRL